MATIGARHYDGQVCNVHGLVPGKTEIIKEVQLFYCPLCANECEHLILTCHFVIQKDTPKTENDDNKNQKC
jgi:uncharacterized protein (UPF0305 family)